MSVPATATQMEDALAALVSPGGGVTGPITATDQAAIMALASAVVPVWEPPVTPLAIYNALGKPANISQLTWVVS